MTKTAKIVLAVIVVLLVAGGIWWWMSMKDESAEYGTQNPSATTTGTNPAAQGNSDSAITSDMTSFDGQMNGLNSDSASVDQNLNDQPVQQQQF